MEIFRRIYVYVHEDVYYLNKSVENVICWVMVRKGIKIGDLYISTYMNTFILSKQQTVKPTWVDGLDIMGKTDASVIWGVNKITPKIKKWEL